MTGLLDLPAEIIQQIHLYSLNPFFPQIHPLLHAILHELPPNYVARYLLNLYEEYGPGDILLRSVRHPVCTVAVARELRRLWDKQRGYEPPVVPPAPTTPASSTKVLAGPPQTPGPSSSTREGPSPQPHTPTTAPSNACRRHRRTSTSSSGSDNASRPSTPAPTAPPLACSELPRRIFRTMSPSSDPSASRPLDPLLEYLIDHYQASPNSHQGYPLCRAVLTSDHRLIEYLLRHGADPSIKTSLAVEIAIKKKDLRAVKLLIERKQGEVGGEVEDLEGRMNGRERRRKKRRRMSDRLIITSRLVELAMKKGSPDIVNYFVEEKGIVPPLNSILAMTRGTPSSTSKPVLKRSGGLRGRVIRSSA